MGTKNNPGLYDCYENADPDEPMFVLLGRDKHAPAMVWLWATLREIDGEDAGRVAEARACAGNMVSWAYDHGKQSVGFGQAALAGVMELIRTVNDLAAHMGLQHKNQMIDAEALRMFLSETKFSTAENDETPNDH